MDEVRNDIWVNTDYDEPPTRYVPATQPAIVNENAQLDAKLPDGDVADSLAPEAKPQPNGESSGGEQPAANEQAPPMLTPISAAPPSADAIEKTTSEKTSQTAEDGAESPTGGDSTQESNSARLRSASVPEPPLFKTALPANPESVQEMDEAGETDDQLGELADSSGVRPSGSMRAYPPGPEGGVAGQQQQPRRRFSLDGAMKAMGLTNKGKGAAPMEAGPEPGVRVVKGRYNSATTSSKSAEEIIAEVLRVLEENEIEHARAGFTVTAWGVVDGRKALRVEFEACHIPKLQMNGLHLKRLMGDTWAYKKFCTNILSQMRL